MIAKTILTFKIPKYRKRKQMILIWTKFNILMKKLYFVSVIALTLLKADIATTPVLSTFYCGEVDRRMV